MRTSLLGHESNLLHFAERNALLSVYDDQDPCKLRKISLADLVRTRCSSLYIPFRPPWWLSNGHVQTIYNELGDFTNVDVVNYRRQLLRTSDGGTLGLDFTPVKFPAFPDDSPIIVVTHGLTGGSQDKYLRAVLKRSCAPVTEGGLGYRAVVVLFRGCDGTPVTSPQLYSAGHTDDLRQALIYLRYKYPRARLLGLGFSLGANVMTRYVAEEGKASLLSSLCVLSSPWSFVESCHRLEHSFVGDLYNRALGACVINLIKHHQTTLLSFHDHPISNAAASALNLKFPTMKQIDEVFGSQLGDAPRFPFPTAHDYYQWASSDYLIDKVRVPMLCIDAADDPIVARAPMDARGNPFIVMALTKVGGHLGWFECKERRWFTRPVLEWLHLMGEDVVLDWTTGPNKIYIDKEGFVRQEGRDSLGCKEVEASSKSNVSKPPKGRGVLEVIWPQNVGSHLRSTLAKLYPVL